jgi:hypothetical protein
VKTGIHHQDEHVERVAILSERAGEESVVTGVVDCAVEHAVEPIDPQRLVELVLVALVGRNLDDGGQFVRRPAAGGDVVPGVETTRGFGRHCSAPGSGLRGN